MNQEESKSLFWHRAKFLALIAVFLSPFIGGWLALYVFDVKPSSGNYGTLVSPAKRLSWPVLETLDGQRYESGFGRKWTLLIFAGAACDELCRNNLFYMRQLRTLLGRDTLRLQNVLISSGPLSETTRIYLRDFPNLKVIENYSDEGLYGDPDQNLMMHYPAEVNQDRVLEDVKKLMKLSQIG
jgi:hypothetical protein